MCVNKLECCGGLGPDDYHFSAWFNHTPDSDGSFVPLSCCGASTRDYYCQFEAMAIIQRDDKPNNIIRAQVYRASTRGECKGGDGGLGPMAAS